MIIVKSINQRFWLLIVGAIICAIGVGFVIGELSELVSLSTLIVLIGGGIFLYISLINYKLGVLGYFVLLLGFFDLIGYQSLLNIGFRIFLADVVIFLVAMLVMQLSIRKDLRRCLSSPISLLVLVNLIYGVVCIPIGFYAGNQINDIFGDFRRFFVYPLAVFIAIGYFNHNIRDSDSKRFVSIMNVIALSISSIALWRVITGQTFDPNQFEPAEQYRALGYIGTAILLMMVSVTYSQTLVAPRSQKWLLGGFSAILVVLNLLSGYRMSWIMAFVAPMCVWGSFRLLSGEYRKLFGLLQIFFLLALVMFVGGSILNRFLPDLFNKIADRVLVSLVEFEITSDMRYYAWTAAFNKFLTSPLVGIGIGDMLEYYTLNSLKTYYLRSGTVHNILLSVLYKTGTLGFLLFSCIHIQAVRYVSKMACGFPAKKRALIAGLFGGYVSILATAMVQPLVESPGANVVLYLWIGAMVGMTKAWAKKYSMTQGGHNGD